MIVDCMTVASSGVWWGAAQVFEQFLAGETLQECYEAVGAVANRWLDLLDTQVGATWVGRVDVSRCCVC